ncbi:MAG: hypothetical protein WAN46_01790 [Gammaproteobacteria bacterium]|jgi:hypothetical protein
MNHLASAAALSIVALAMVGCASTEIKDSWRNPEATPESFQFKKILAMAIVDDIVTRRVAEDELADLIDRAEVVPSYTILTQADLQNPERAKEKIKEEGFDGVVTLRVANVDKTVTYVPGSYAGPYSSFWGYYGYAWPTTYDSGYMRTDTVATIEANIYALNPEKLLWSGTSETFNPGTAREVIDDIAAAVGAELMKQGLMAPK